MPDIVISSCSIRAQETADGLADKLEFEGPRHYLQELYLTQPKTLQETLMMQENHFDSILVVGHNPQVTEFAKILTEGAVAKIPSLGVVAINLDIEEWSDIKDSKGEVDFFIYPKQFQYYMPKQIRTTLELG